MLGKMLDFSILYDDGVVKKQAGSTRTVAAPVTTSGGHHKIETNMLRPVLVGAFDFFKSDPNLEDAAAAFNAELVYTQSDVLSGENEAIE